MKKHNRNFHILDILSGKAELPTYRSRDTDLGYFDHLTIGKKGPFQPLTVVEGKELTGIKV